MNDCAFILYVHANLLACANLVRRNPDVYPAEPEIRHPPRTNAELLFDAFILSSFFCLFFFSFLKKFGKFVISSISVRTGLGRISALGHDVAEHVFAGAPIYDVKFHFGSLADVVKAS